MGCGKTTVVTEFERLGVPAFVADKVGGAYYDDASFLAEVHNALGDGVLDAEGRVDKKRIAAIVFSDKEALAKLNALVHPRVMVDFDAFCRQHADKTYVLFESAILYDYGLERYMDKVICVYLSLDASGSLEGARPCWRQCAAGAHTQPIARRGDDATSRLRDTELRGESEKAAGGVLG